MCGERIQLHSPMVMFGNCRAWILILLVAVTTVIRHRAVFGLALTAEQIHDDFEGNDDNNDNIDHDENDDSVTATAIPIAGYLPDYRIEGVPLNQTLPLLSDLILFSMELHSSGRLGGCCLQPKHYQFIQQTINKKKPDLKLWITVGGAGRAHHWQQVCQDSMKRQRFITSMIRLCAREGIQGIDLDWFSQVRLPQEQQLIVSFLQEASPIWHDEGLQISIPLHVGQVLPEPWVYEFVDRINVMVYDAPPGVVSSPQAVEQYGSTAKIRIAYAQYAVNALLQSKCPPYKIWMGIPLYGSQLKDPGQVMTYGDVMMNDFVHKLLSSAQSYTATENVWQLDNSYLVDVLDRAFDGYHYDGPEIILSKLEQVHHQGLGGIFLWELGQDAKNSNTMLSAIWNFTRRHARHDKVGSERDRSDEL